MNLVRTVTISDYQASQIAFTPDSQKLMTGGIQRRSRYAPGYPIFTPWSMDGAECLISITASQHRTRKLSNIEISPNSAFLVSTDQETVYLWDLQTQDLLQTFEPHLSSSEDKRDLRSIDPLFTLAISPDSELLAIGYGNKAYNDKTIQFWHLQTGAFVSELTTDVYGGISNLIFSPDGQTILATGTIEGRDVYYRDSRLQGWSISTGEKLFSMGANLSLIENLGQLDFDPLSGRLVLGGQQDFFEWTFEGNALEMVQS